VHVVWGIIASLAALHLPLILFVPWPIKWIPAIGILPIAVLDCLIILGVGRTGPIKKPHTAFWSDGGLTVHNPDLSSSVRVDGPSGNWKFEGARFLLRFSC
jgi:hypothetical protein